MKRSTSFSMTISVKVLMLALDSMNGFLTEDEEVRRIRFFTEEPSDVLIL